MSIQKFDTQTIRDYYQEAGKIALFPEDGIKFFFGVLGSKKDKIVVSDRKAYRGIAKLRGMDRLPPAQIEVQAQQYFAMKDAFLLLAKKGVPVYFYNRIGKMKNGYQYSKSAVRRMNSGLNFPIMYENIEQYEEDFKEIFGDKYSKEYVMQMGHIPQVVCKGDHYYHEDYKSELINVVGGKRITCYQPENSKRTIHIYGRCGVFGYAVEDADTFPSQLQKLLVENGYNDIRIVNHGLWGGSNVYMDHNFLMDSVGMKQGDIVVFYRMHFEKGLLSHFEENGVWYKDITAKWHESETARNGFYDKPGHMNANGYKVVAKIIYEDLVSHDFQLKKISDRLVQNLNTPALNNYLKNRTETDFERGIREYISQIQKDYPDDSTEGVNGGIVMNCNPFTKGHRYLIEYAAQRVKRLYIFVVEEDHSFFKFADRFEMVVQGTKDLKNVVVVPSGKFIISSITFPEYFMKDYVKEKNFDVSMDVEVFCKYIAPPLGIKVRFAGEEPFDPVTLNYNNNMRRILPEFGMKFCEIPRLKITGNKVVNATEVRRLLKEKKFVEISEYVPDTTLEVLKRKYAD